MVLQEAGAGKGRADAASSSWVDEAIQLDSSWVDDCLPTSVLFSGIADVVNRVVDYFHSMKRLDLCPTALLSSLQALSQDEDDAFTRSVWANSKSLKQHFAGIGSVRLPH